MALELQFKQLPEPIVAFGYLKKKQLFWLIFDDEALQIPKKVLALKVEGNIFAYLVNNDLLRFFRVLLRSSLCYAICVQFFCFNFNRPNLFGSLILNLFMSYIPLPRCLKIQIQSVLIEVYFAKTNKRIVVAGT